MHDGDDKETSFTSSGLSALKLVLTLHVATVTVERCFSAMKIVKTRRNRISDQFLNDCVVCFVEKGLF